MWSRGWSNIPIFGIRYFGISHLVAKESKMSDFERNFVERNWNWIRIWNQSTHAKGWKSIWKFCVGEFQNHRKSEVILDVFCENQIDSVTWWWDFWSITTFSAHKIQVFEWFSSSKYENHNFSHFQGSFPFSQHCPLFATLFRRVKVLRKGIPPVYLFQFTTFSRIHFDWTFYFANILRIHFPFCEQTMNQLKVPLNSLFFSQISFEFTLSFANSLWINVIFRE